MSNDRFVTVNIGANEHLWLHTCGATRRFLATERLVQLVSCGACGREGSWRQLYIVDESQPVCICNPEHRPDDPICQYQPAPRSWSLPAPPGPEVTGLRDRDGALWTRSKEHAPLFEVRDEHGWLVAVKSFHELYRSVSPLTDATPVAASPVSDKEGRA